MHSDLEAEQYLSERFRGECEASTPARFWGKQAERKRWIKLHVWNRLPLPLRPFLLLFGNYFLKGGFLDGKPGFVLPRAVELLGAITDRREDHREAAGRGSRKRRHESPSETRCVQGGPHSMSLFSANRSLVSQGLEKR